MDRGNGGIGTAPRKGPSRYPVFPGAPSEIRPFRPSGRSRHAGRSLPPTARDRPKSARGCPDVWCRTRAKTDGAAPSTRRAPRGSYGTAACVWRCPENAEGVAESALGCPTNMESILGTRSRRRRGARAGAKRRVEAALRRTRLARGLTRTGQADWPERVGPLHVSAAPQVQTVRERRVHCRASGGVHACPQPILVERCPCRRFRSHRRCGRVRRQRRNEPRRARRRRHRRRWRHCQRR